jgi:hypothetical protein
MRSRASSRHRERGLIFVRSNAKDASLKVGPGIFSRVDLRAEIEENQVARGQRVTVPLVGIDAPDSDP